MNYLNENDPHAAAWLRSLIADGHLPPGHVDERSITEIKPHELDGYTQHHFFAGIGGWILAFQLAGWPIDRPVWSGSCPCQPWSVGNTIEGGGRGFDDPRHLWPAWHGLIDKQGPPVVFGEQVANAVGKGWWDKVARDLEESDFACAAAVLPACSFGADFERKRLCWVAVANGQGRQGYQPIQRFPLTEEGAFAIDGNALARARSALGGDYSGLLSSDGLPVKVARSAVKGFGNAIVPQVAAEFINAFLETEP